MVVFSASPYIYPSFLPSAHPAPLLNFLLSPFISLLFLNSASSFFTVTIILVLFLCSLKSFPSYLILCLFLFLIAFFCWATSISGLICQATILTVLISSPYFNLMDSSHLYLLLLTFRGTHLTFFCFHLLFFPLIYPPRLLMFTLLIALSPTTVSSLSLFLSSFHPSHLPVLFGISVSSIPPCFLTVLPSYFLLAAISPSHLMKCTLFSLTLCV